MTRFETKDSGARAQYESGMQRDTEEGKARFDLLIPDGVPYEAQLLTRFAELMGRGAVKYEDRNWEKADSDAEIRRAKSSAFRHFMQWLCGEVDEDHAVATMFNILVVETTKHKIEEPDHDYEAVALEIVERSRRPGHMPGQSVREAPMPGMPSEAQDLFVDPHPRNESDLAAESVEAAGISAGGIVHIQHVVTEDAPRTVMQQAIHDNFNRVRHENLRF